MSKDRKVATDALETLGTIIDDAQKRDAIHLAVEPIVATETLEPGQHVGLVEGGAGRSDEPVGIVDPFLAAPVRPGERFWLVLYPRVITSLRHVWSHPAFDDERTASPASVDGSREASRLWLEDYAERLFDYEPDYGGTKLDALLDCAESGAFGDDLNYEGGLREPNDEFWRHFERYTGRAVPRETRPTFFRCAC
jgi:hypothetical protein